MIDTLKIVTMIPSNTYTILKEQCITKTSYHNDTGEIFYDIQTNHIQRFLFF